LDKNFKGKQRKSLKIFLLYALGAEPKPIITSPLKITPPSPYQVGDIINAEFTITNQGKLPINFSVLTVGGRNSDNQIADFSQRRNITIEPFESYNYQGTLTLNKVGDYHFFCTYQMPDGNWNTCVDLGSGLTDEDRSEGISVEEKEKPQSEIVSDKKVYTIQVGAFSKEINAQNFAKEIRDKGYQIYVVKGKTLYKVQVGEFKNYEEAQNISQKLKELGYPIFITTR